MGVEPHSKFSASGFNLRIFQILFLSSDDMRILWVALAAMVAGAVNAVAGGGTFLAFPALTTIGGLTEKSANIACTIGLWPGSAGSIFPARKELSHLPVRIVSIYALLCLAGGTLGSLLLRYTPARDFSLAIPWLLGFATLVFAMGPRISAFARSKSEGPRHPIWFFIVGATQFVVAIYGGYFGAGIGILTLAGLSLTGLGEMRRLNALKVLLSTMTNLSAAVVFLFGNVEWRYVGPMAGASLIGGIVGMLGAQRLPQKVLRGVILLVGITLTAVYFQKEYLR
jgi:uncharacterized membrane protein YfcA